MELNQYEIISVSLETLTLGFIALVFYSNFRSPRKTRKEIRLQNVLILLFLMIFLDLVSWLFDGKTGTLAWFMVHGGNAGYYLISPACYALYALYLGTGINGERLLRGNSRKIYYVILGLTAIQEMLLVVNCWSHILYWIDSSNHHHLGPHSLLPGVLAVLQLLLMVVEVLLIPEAYRFGRSLLVHLGIYIMFPLVGAVVQAFNRDLATMHIALLFSIYLVYVNVHMDTQKVILERNLQLSQSQVEHLTWQIHPHFIFNSLMAIKELCEVDGPKAGEAVQDFADYLRGNLDAMSSQELIPFEQELMNIRHYLALEMVDPSWNIQVDYILEEKDFKLPALSVEPLVENAVRHGIGHRTQGGRITIHSWMDRGDICVAVRDDGVGFRKDTVQQKDRKSLGLQNVRDRLEAQCGGRLDIESSSGGTRVTIRIPRENLPADNGGRGM